MGMNSCILKYEYNLLPQLKEIAKRVKFLVAEVERTEATLDNELIFQATHALLSWPMALGYILLWGRSIQLE